MKLYKIRRRKVTLKEYGRCEQVRVYPLGLKRLGFAIAHFPIEVPKQEMKLEETVRHNIKEAEEYEMWRKKMKLMRLDDEQFDMILNTRF